MQSNVNEDTYPKLMRGCASRIGNRPAFREKEFGIWQTTSWSEVRHSVAAFAGGLAARGVVRGDRAMVIGSNRPRLYQAISALQSLGVIPIPTYSDSVAEEMQYVIEHAEATIVVAEDQEQVDKVLEVIDRCPAIRLIIYDDDRGLRDYDADLVVSYDSVQQQGREYNQKNPEFFEAEVDKGKASDTAVLLYTSGTTGRPKGVVLSHDNIISNTRAVVELEQFNEKDSVIAYLPMAWIVDYFISYSTAHVCGLCVCCPESTETLEQDKQEIGPTFHFTSPRVLEMARTEIMIRMEDGSKLKRRMFRYFVDVAERIGIDIAEKRDVSFKDKMLYRLGDIMVYGPLRNMLGYTRTRLIWTAGEAIGPDMFNFYRSLGLHLKQVYGQTEASPFVTAQPDNEVRPDTVGKPLSGVEVMISDAGEVLYRGPGVFQEYYKNPDATSETKSDAGWVHTGDTGFFDDEGHLKIIDRAKDVGKLTSGAMFAPKYIENKIKFFPEILEAVSIGHDRDFVTAMVNIDLGAVGDWAERRGLSYASYQELAGHPDVYELVEERLRQVNLDLAADELLSSSQIRRFLILHKELDADDGELTRTRKVRRRIIAERYEPLIEALYGGQEQCHIETEVTFEDGRTGMIGGDLKIRDVEVFDRVAKAG